jgi:phosphatidyl-myo-inositol alpha-mannosyltransferase
VVCSDIAGYREVIRDGCEGLLVPPADASALAAALLRLLGDRQLRGEMSAAGVRRAVDFDWANVTRRVEAYYFRVLEDALRLHGTATAAR